MDGWGWNENWDNPFLIHKCTSFEIKFYRFLIGPLAQENKTQTSFERGQGQIYETYVEDVGKEWWFHGLPTTYWRMLDPFFFPSKC
jgi:hypothetical protein